MEDQDLRVLLTKYEQGTCTPQEAAWVEEWYRTIASHESLPDPLPRLKEAKADIWERLSSQDLPQATPKWYYFAAAASFILILISSVFFYYSSRPKDYLAGGNYATLKMSNGETFSLTPDQNGRICDRPGLTIRSDSGKITYIVDSTKHANSSIVNTITTPRGGQFKVILPDGSLVFLNAESSLSFLEVFGQERMVTLTGEGYFEIKKNVNKPFCVQSANLQMLRVTGTHFNVSSYFNSAVVTLLEGGVKIQPVKGAQVILHPGEQSVNDGRSIQVQQVNAEDYVGWKEGMFIWNGCPVKEVLQQLSSWYNLDFEYTHLNHTNIYGRISRTLPLSKVLTQIEEGNHMKFIIRGRRIMIQ